MPIQPPLFYKGITMLSTIYNHDFETHEIEEIILKMANLRNAVANGEGEKERAKLHYAIERFCMGDREVKNIGHLYPIYKEMAETIKPTWTFYEMNKGVL